jgi:hypothetical protein
MAIGDIVLDSHKAIFARVAKEPPTGVGVWILVRGTNKNSLNYIGRSGYTPKPIDCKAKTAKLGPCAGLVVNPYEAAQAFDDLPAQKRFWDEHGNPLKYSSRAARYSIESTGPLKGCVKLDGRYIYGDYDLKAVVVPGHESATVALVTELQGVQNARRGPKFFEVQRLVNNAIGVEMVQHGAEDEFTGHSDDSIFVFGPKGEYEELHGIAQIQGWYNKICRRTLDKDFTGGVPSGLSPGIRGVVQPDGSIRPVNFRKP